MCIVPLLHTFALCRPTYVEGRLRLAERERARQRARGPAAEEGPASKQSLEALQAAADANMLALLQEEDAAKVRQSDEKEKKGGLCMRHTVCFLVYMQIIVFTLVHTGSSSTSKQKAGKEPEEERGGCQGRRRRRSALH